MLDRLRALRDCYPTANVRIVGAVGLAAYLVARLSL
jgi:hypothetical protein